MTCDKKWILHSNWQWSAQWLNWEEAPKHFPKPSLYQKKIVMVSVWWSDPLQLSKSQRNYYTWEICAANQWAALMHWKLQCLQPALVNRMCPVLPHVTRWMNGAIKFCLIHHIHLTSPQPTTTSSSSSTFLQGKCFHNQQDTENAFQVFIKFWSTDFYTTEINLFLSGKNVLIVMVPIFINTDVCEPSYNDLKFIIWNHDYFCTKNFYRQKVTKEKW